jgi:hypothetical protein
MDRKLNWVVENYGTVLNGSVVVDTWLCICLHNYTPKTGIFTVNIKKKKKKQDAKEPSIEYGLWQMNVTVL